MTQTNTKIALGLIGDNINASSSPDLHRMCGEFSKLDVSYDLYIPSVIGKNFEAVFNQCQLDGLAGVNITLPYKERVLSQVKIDDINIKRIGAVNTVLFTKDGPIGYNTDYTGFISAYRSVLKDKLPGKVVLIGAGGVGKAIAFGLIVLKAKEIVFVDHDRKKAESLAKAVFEASNGKTQTYVSDISSALVGADGVINCTPIGMVGYEGSPVKDEEFPEGGWAFDAVYTPVNTLFKGQAEKAGSTFISGYELFFNQGLDAFEIFTGEKRPENTVALREKLIEICN